MSVLVLAVFALQVSAQSRKRVEPLYWINPNNYVYSELNKPTHMKLPKIVLPDADKDGVTDQFDLEPNTPAGAPVDSHGVSKDTDGDGVPDFKDKELLTAQKCFPVNADGIGNCPEPACCKEIRDMVSNMKPVAVVECTIGGLPSVQFKGKAKLTNSTIKANVEAMQLALMYTLAKDTTAYVAYGTESIAHPSFTKTVEQTNTQIGLRYKF